MDTQASEGSSQTDTHCVSASPHRAPPRALHCRCPWAPPAPFAKLVDGARRVIQFFETRPRHTIPFYDDARDLLLGSQMEQSLLATDANRAADATGAAAGQIGVMPQQADCDIIVGLVRSADPEHRIAYPQLNADFSVWCSDCRTFYVFENRCSALDHSRHGRGASERQRSSPTMGMRPAAEPPPLSSEWDGQVWVQQPKGGGSAAGRRCVNLDGNLVLMIKLK